QKFRIRIGPQGVDVIYPSERPTGQIKPFLRKNEKWIIDQLKRVHAIRRVRKSQEDSSQILFRGIPTPIVVLEASERRRKNKVLFDGETLVILKGSKSKTHSSKSLEYWLRRQARADI